MPTVFKLMTIPTAVAKTRMKNKNKYMHFYLIFDDLFLHSPFPAIALKATMLWIVVISSSGRSNLITVHYRSLHGIVRTTVYDPTGSDGCPPPFLMAEFFPSFVDGTKSIP